jgi:cytochrome c553
MKSFNSKPLLALACMAFATIVVTPAHAKGETIANELCAGCHGPGGNSMVPSFPKLAGQQKVYLLRELKDYRSGKRASEIMVPLVSTLSDDDLSNLADYYAKQKPAKPEPSATSNRAQLAIGKKLYLQGNNDTDVPSCESCHETDGSGSGKFPRVAGQHVEYTLDQFRLYATGKRTNGSRVMQAVANRMSEEETRAVSEYMASLP